MTALYVNTHAAGPLVWIVSAFVVAALGVPGLLTWLAQRRWNWKRAAVVALVVLAVLAYSAQEAYAALWCCCEGWRCWFILL